MPSSAWPALPSYESWSETCDTLHAHTQVLGKLAATIGPPEPQLQHAALRLTARGWETPPLPAPDGSGAFLVALDLHRHEALVEHSDGRATRIALTPHRAVGEVTRELLAAVRGLAGAVEIDPTPQEVSWTVPLDEDDEHATYDTGQVATYFADATLEPSAARWDGALGEYVLDWDDVVATADPHATVLRFARSAFRHACAVCEWDPELA